MGIINGILGIVKESQRKEFEIRRDMYHEQRTKRDYYRSAKCPRARGGGADKCATCTLAPACKTGSRRW